MKKQIFFLIAPFLALPGLSQAQSPYGPPYNPSYPADIPINGEPSYQQNPYEQTPCSETRDTYTPRPRDVYYPDLGLPDGGDLFRNPEEFVRRRNEYYRANPRVPGDGFFVPEEQPPYRRHPQLPPPHFYPQDPWQPQPYPPLPPPRFCCFLMPPGYQQPY